MISGWYCGYLLVSFHFGDKERTTVIKQYLFFLWIISIELSIHLKAETNKSSILQVNIEDHWFLILWLIFLKSKFKSGIDIFWSACIAWEIDNLSFLININDAIRKGNTSKHIHSLCQMMIDLFFSESVGEHQGFGKYECETSHELDGTKLLCPWCIVKLLVNEALQRIEIEDRLNSGAVRVLELFVCDGKFHLVLGHVHVGK